MSSYPIANIAARWAGGKTWAEYFDVMQKNRDLIAAISKEIRFSDADKKSFRDLFARHGNAQALVISEDWCPDCALNVPVLMQIAQLIPALNVRFFKKDEVDDIHAYALKGERKAIPTFIFFDAQWNEIGHWLERPVKADMRLSEWDQTHPAPTEPERTADVWKHYRNARSEYRNELFLEGSLWRETIAELRLILGREVFNNQLVMAQTR